MNRSSKQRHSQRKRSATYKAAREARGEDTVKSPYNSPYGFRLLKKGEKLPKELLRVPAAPERRTEPRYVPTPGDKAAVAAIKKRVKPAGKTA